MNSPHQQPSLIHSCIPLITFQIITAVLASIATEGFTRPVALMVAIPLVTALFCTTNRVPQRLLTCLVAVLASTTATLGILHALRQFFDSAWLLGPFPNDLQFACYAVILVATVLTAACIRAAFSSSGIFHRGRWFILGLVATTLFGLGVLARMSIWEPSPSDLLHSVAHYEQLQSATGDSAQQLGWMLAICGRDAEVESLSKVSAGVAAPPRAKPIDLQQLKPLPWRDAFREIAEREQVVIIMEAHDAPKHRQWIEQTLPILHNAGFRDYAAEAFSESGAAIKHRGYPTSSSGFYISDPSFGNLLRTAVEFDFDLHAYESHGTDFELREREQARTLARLLAKDKQRKLVVHAGYGHVRKLPSENGFKAMAAYLWEITGIEPYCIYQTYHKPETRAAHQLAGLVETAGEPIMLTSPPTDLIGSSTDFPAGSIDALVVHPPRVGDPADRVHSFPSVRDRVAGTWSGDEWPVLLAAVKKGELAEAIALDQVMLREGERDFVLWVPMKYGDAFELRVFGLGGELDGAEVER